MIRWNGVDYEDLPLELLAELADAGLEPRAVYDLVVAALAEDLPGGALGPGDVTSEATLDPQAMGVADFTVREDGVLAGLVIAELAFLGMLGEAVTVSGRLADGTRVRAGEVVMTVSGPVARLLTVERTALNIASHLCGVATATDHWVQAVAGTSARILDTRKTLPGLRALQKYAVRCGGGVNHRFSLSDMAMVKDNHVIAAGGVVPAFEAVREAFPDIPVVVEATTLEQLRELIAAGCEHVLLDNMSPAMMAEAVEITAGATVLEASGGLTLERARTVAETGVDYISVGALTHSVKVFDLGMDLR